MNKFILLVSVAVLGLSNAFASKEIIHSSGEGFFTANVVIAALPSETVQALIKNDKLMLAEQQFTQAGTHPVILLFGQQKNVHAIVNGKSLPSPFGDYKEFAVLVPFVTIPGKDKAFAYMPKLYLDNLRAIAAGYYYGMNKSLADIRIGDGTYKVSTEVTHKLLISGRFEEKTEFNRDALDQNFSQIREAMELPLINRRLNKFICAVQKWDFDSMEIAPYRSSVKLSLSLLEGVLPQKLNSDALDEAALGSFGMKGRWTLTSPLDCK